MVISQKTLVQCQLHGLHENLQFGSEKWFTYFFKEHLIPPHNLKTVLTGLIQEKMWIELPHHPMLLRKYVLFFWASAFLWQFMVCFGMNFLWLDVGLSQQLPLRVITLCQKNSPSQFYSASCYFWLLSYTAFQIITCFILFSSLAKFLMSVLVSVGSLLFF